MTIKKKAPKKYCGVPSLNQMLPKSGGSIFCLARMAMQRSKEIYDGAPALVDHPPLDKATTIALKEISAGKVALKDLDPGQKPGNDGLS